MAGVRVEKGGASGILCYALCALVSETRGEEEVGKFMAENMLSNRPVYGRTFHTAMWTIGMLAAVQLFAVIRAVMMRPATPEMRMSELVPVLPPRPFPEVSVPPAQAPGAGLAPASDAAAVAAAASLAPTDAAARPDGDPGSGGLALDPGIVSGEAGTNGDRSAPASARLPANMGSRSPTVPAESANPLPGPTFFGPSGAAVPSLSESLSTAAVDAEKIQDPILERLVSAGEELRAAGNMSGALQALREAESALPEHPRILGEMAATFSQMGLDEKADVYWEKIVSLGAIRGGAFYDLADRQLRGEQAPVSGASGQVMKIGQVEVDELPPDDGGQRVSLRIVVDADPAANLIGSDMSLLVYFYDLVDGETIDPSTADTSYDYPTKEYDWRDGGKEEIIVDYRQPVFSEEELRELGVRRYYGYVIELYYQDKLQDRIAMPEELSRFGGDAPEEPEPPSRIGPENALFPETPNF